MGLIVQKFGGSSVRDRERLLRAMRIVRRTWEQGDDVVVVLSAQGDTTDALLARARELTEEPPLRELDALLESHELVKGKVLESAMLTPRTVSEALCEATGADAVQCIGSKFVLYRQSSDEDKRKIVLVK